MRPVSLSVRTIYSDLVEAHREHALADIGGTPFAKSTPKGDYWYARQRIGDRIVDRYLGPDSAEMRARLERVRDGASNRDFERHASERVNQLRAAGLPSLDRDTGKVLNALARAGAFRLGGTLVGTHAFRLYAAELGVLFPTLMAVTQDVDIAAFENLKLVVEDPADPQIAEVLRLLDLKPVPTMDAKHRSTRWRMKGGNVALDFLAPMMTASQDIVPIRPLGVHAQGLPFLNFLVAEPLPAVALYRSGVLVQVPRPERYAIHKLIVAQKRSGSDTSKAQKDLLQAEALIEALWEDRPYPLRDALTSARGNGPKWREAIERSLAQKPRIAQLLGDFG